MKVEEIAEMLVAQDKRVSVAEADTCGLVGYMLSTVPGSSRWFPGGVIAYTGGLKQSILGVSDELYETKGSVSPEMAVAMAVGVRDLTGTDYGISVTGVAGPTGGSSGLPIGTFYIGVAGSACSVPRSSAWASPAGSASTGLPKRRNSAGTTSMFRNVDDSRPHRMTMAIGVRISRPGCSPPSASGTRARPAARAVIRIGASRSIAPRRTASWKSVTPSKR